MSGINRMLSGIVLMSSMYVGGSALAEENPEQDGVEVGEEEKKSPVSGSVELMGGHEGASLDAKVGVNLGKGFGLFSRQFGNLSYGDVGIAYSHFGLFDLSHNLGDGCDVFSELRYSISALDDPKKPEIAVSPRVGIQGYGGVGGLKVYGNASLDVLKRDSGARVEFLGVASYDIELSDNLSLIPGMEVIIDIADDGNVSVIERPRLSLGGDHFRAGVAVNLGQSYNAESDKVDVDVNVGASAQVNF